MRVLHTIYSIRPETGGPARSVPALVQSLNDAGVEAKVCVTEPQGPEHPTFHAVCRDWSPQIIHDHGLWLPANHRVARSANLQKLPYVISPRGMLEPWSLRHRRWKKTIAWHVYQKRDLKRAAMLHATSDEEAAQFRVLGLHQPIVILPNGVSVPSNLDQLTRTSGSVRELLFMSRIHPKKGLMLLVEAWSRLRRENWRIRIVGPDESGHAAEVQAAVDARGLTATIEISPPVDDREKWSVLRSAAAFVLPTYSENFGIAVAEAMAAGLPVITTTGTPWRLLDHWQCGWCVEPEVDALTNALDAVTQMSDSQRAKMGERGQSIVTDRFLWPAIGRKLRTAYEWLLGGEARPDCVHLGSESSTL